MRLVGLLSLLLFGFFSEVGESSNIFRSLIDRLCGNGNAVATAAAPPPYFWKVTSDAGNESYLFGAFHRGVHIESINELVLEKFRASEHYIMEADADPFLMEAKEGDRYPRFNPIYLYQDRSKTPKNSTLLSAGAWKLVQKHLGPFFDPDELEVMDLEIMITFLVVSETIAAKSAEEIVYSMSADLRDRALEDEKPVTYLETEEELKQLFRVAWWKRIVGIGRNDHTEKGILKQMAEMYRLLGPIEPDALVIAQKQFAEDRLLYLQGQDVDLADYLKDPLGITGKRTKNWMRRLPAALDVGNAFVAVGAGNLEGDSGLLKLLEERGYRLERLN